MKNKKEISAPLKRQTYYLTQENIEALFLWNVETREGLSNLINRLIEENCPEEIMKKAKKNVDIHISTQKDAIDKEETR